MDPLLARLAEIARRHVAPERRDLLSDPDVALELTSLATVAFLVDVEEALSVRVPDHAIDASTFRTLRSVADCVRTAPTTGDDGSASGDDA